MSACRILVPRAVHQADELASELRRLGAEPVLVPTIAIELEPPGGALDELADALCTFAWVVITSANAARALVGATGGEPTALATTRWAVIGRASRAVIEHAGINVDFQPRQSSGLAMAVELPMVAGERVLVARGDLADEALAVALRARGADVDDRVVYRTREAPTTSRPLLSRAVADGSIDAIVFTSGSTVRGLVALSRAESFDVTSVPAVCIGPQTAAEARDHGFRIIAVSATQDAAALAATTAQALAMPTERP